MKGDRVRVLLYTNSSLTGGLKGGMERVMELIAKHLDRSRFAVYGMIPEVASADSFAADFARYTDELVRLRFDSNRRDTLPRFVAQLRKWGIDVMHLHNGHFRGQVLTTYAARLAGVSKVFVTEHQAPHAPEALRVRLNHWVLGPALRGIISVSKHNFDGRSQYLYTPRGHIVENGVDVDDFVPIREATLAELRQRHDLPADAEIVGTVVRFEEEKGLRYLIDALPKITKALPKAYLLMVGEGSLRSALEQRVAELGLTSRVRFTGFQADPRPYLGLIDVFVLPVPEGSMSIAVLEAMAMRCALVITFGDDGEAVVHQQTGMRARPRDPEHIADSVIEILGTPGLRRKFGDAGRKHVEEHFSAKSNARRLEAIYLG